MPSLLLKSSRRAKKRTRSQTGSIIILVGVLFPVLMGFAGFAIDLGLAMVYRTEEQRAADAASIAGSEVYLSTGSKDQSEAKAIEYAKKNGYENGVKSTTVAVTWPATCGKGTTYSSPDKCLKVAISRTHSTLFLRVLGKNTATTGATAVGVVTTGERNYALIVLDPTVCNAYNHSSSNSLTINGGGAIIDSNATTGGNCVGTSASQGGGSIVTAQNCINKAGETIPCTLDYYAPGNWVQSNNASSNPAPTSVGSPVPDPLAALARPIPCTDGTPGSLGTTPAGCNIPISPTACGNSAIPCATNKVSTAANPQLTQISGNGSVTLSPGVYYGGLKIVGQTVTFSPGTYVFAGGGSSSGGFTFNSNNPATGNGVTFFNTGDPYASGSNKACGSFSIAASGVLTLKAPTDTGAIGPFDDTSPANGVETMLFWQDDRTTGVWAGKCTEDFKYTGSGATTAGIIYLPTAKFDMAGGGNLGAIQVIVNTFDFHGNANVTINYNRYVETARPRWRLVE